MMLAFIQVFLFELWLFEARTPSLWEAVMAPRKGMRDGELSAIVNSGNSAQIFLKKIFFLSFPSILPSLSSYLYYLGLEIYIQLIQSCSLIGQQLGSTLSRFGSVAAPVSRVWTALIGRVPGCLEFQAAADILSSEWFCLIHISQRAS